MEGLDMDIYKAREFFVDSPPFIINDVYDGRTYTFAVQLVTSRGFRSALSEIYSYEMAAGKFAFVFGSHYTFANILNGLGYCWVKIEKREHFRFHFIIVFIVKMYLH